VNKVWLICSLLFLPIVSYSQKNNCEFVNDVFGANEKISYQIFYNWGVIWVGAGEAIFTTELILQNKKPYYKLVGEGYTYPKYDWFYKVRDRFESIVDTHNLKPIRFIRDSKEGGNNNYSDNVFNFSKRKAYSFTRLKKQSIKADSVAITTCTFDVLSMIYYARNIDFDLYKPKDRIPISLYLDNAVYPLYIEYLGKEKIQTELGEFNCIKFHPMLVEGTIFKAGDDMTVWVTDDKNKIPLYVETPIIVGSIKAKLKSYSGIRNPLNSKIK
jgi:hypothetical protein